MKINTALIVTRIIANRLFDITIIDIWVYTAVPAVHWCQIGSQSGQNKTNMWLFINSSSVHIGLVFLQLIFKKSHARLICPYLCQILFRKSQMWPAWHRYRVDQTNRWKASYSNHWFCVSVTPASGCPVAVFVVGVLCACRRSHTWSIILSLTHLTHLWLTHLWSGSHG